MTSNTNNRFSALITSDSIESENKQKKPSKKTKKNKMINTQTMTITPKLEIGWMCSNFFAKDPVNQRAHLENLNNISWKVFWLRTIGFEDSMGLSDGRLLGNSDYRERFFNVKLNAVCWLGSIHDNCMFENHYRRLQGYDSEQLVKKRYILNEVKKQIKNSLETVYNSHNLRNLNRSMSKWGYKPRDQTSYPPQKERWCWIFYLHIRALEIRLIENALLENIPQDDQHCLACFYELYSAISALGKSSLKKETGDYFPKLLVEMRHYGTRLIFKYCSAKTVNKAGPLSENLLLRKFNLS
jgi:hypothetical protein